MIRFYASLGLLATVVAVGLPTAGWLYDAFDAPTAFYLDTFGIVLPFFLVSLYLLKQSWRAIRERPRLVPRPLAVAVVVVVFALYAVTVRNLRIAFGHAFGGA